MCTNPSHNGKVAMWCSECFGALKAERDAALRQNAEYQKALEKISGEVLLQAECRKIAFDALGWVTARCTSPACRGRRKGGEGFEVTVRRGQEAGAMCNECFCR